MTTERPATGHELFLLDVNALVALCVANHVHHGAAQHFLAGVERWATTPMTEAGLVRLLLNPAVVGRETPTGRRLVSGAAAVKR